MWRFTNKPTWHPQIFKHKFGSHYGDMFDRRYLLARNPYEDSDFVDKGNEPLTNLIANQNRYVLEIPVPGFTKENISVHIEDDVLTVKGKREKDDLNDSNYIILEHDLEQFERSFQLGSITDQDNIEARVKNGVLYITLHHKKDADEDKNVVKDIPIK
ncbi:MAG: Hsp20/alpha crystallin family protein [Crocinitomicaceae bacterium]|nr:Hsp20/alpha crystallin family protein [Crocinitomicaceae bacterium]